MKKVMLSDERCKVKNGAEREYEVFTYSREEQETIINYNPVDDNFKVWTNYQPHITKILKLKNIGFGIESVNANGTITSMVAYLSGKQIMFCNPREKREYSEEERAKMRERAKAMHKR